MSGDRRFLVQHFHRVTPLFKSHFCPLVVLESVIPGSARPLVESGPVVPYSAPMLDPTGLYPAIDSPVDLVPTRKRVETSLLIHLEFSVPDGCYCSVNTVAGLVRLAHYAY